jgi:uncharacterized membrane protein YhiD involved in acid resistance
MEIIDRLLLTGPDLKDALISLTIAACLGLLIAQLYRYTHRGLNYEHTFMAALVMLAPIVAVVMLYIRNDLVLSLGLIGSLSIVRFRTAIKDTRDMAFLFWVIAIGLGSGTYNWGVVVVSSIFILILVAGLYFVRFGHTLNSDFVLVLTGKPPFENESARAIIQRFSTEARLRSQDLQDTHFEMVFELHLTDSSSSNADTLINELKALPGVAEVSLMAPQLALPL